MLTSQRRSTLCPYTTLFRSIFLNGQKKGVEKVSQPNIPDIDPNISLTREDAINLLLTSIAMEELGLAHIIKDRKSTRLNSSHVAISYAVFCLKKKKKMKKHH